MILVPPQPGALDDYGYSLFVKTVRRLAPIYMKVPVLG